ncbi:hypothetical protein P389DRAFT_174610 [Cystobasidium minutum MCA 4210]|uniref:uncharacterized protein n=1 Tax=Cystobasidium minutum MCA 4210 TaxID=1397322 RepID=UPI0034CD40A4|eukprot:jgi/Rhomi1/174610/fgenesh1_kg.8_\
MATEQRTESKTKLDTLPAEVLDRVLAYLPDDLARCVRIYKAFAAQVQPIINRTVHLTANNLGQFLNMIDSKSPECREQRLTEIHDFSMDDFGTSKRQDEQIPWIVEMVPSMSLLRLKLSPRIRPISDGEPARWVDRLAATISTSELKHIDIIILGQNEGSYRQLIARSAKTLQTLHVEDWITFAPAHGPSKVNMPIFQALRKVVYEAESAGEDAREPKSQLVDVMKNAINLQELCLYGSAIYKHRRILKVSRLNLRNLYLDDESSRIFSEPGLAGAVDVLPRLVNLRVHAPPTSFNVQALPQYIPHLQQFNIDYMHAELPHLLEVLRDVTQLAMLKDLHIGVLFTYANKQDAYPELQDICQARRIQVHVGQLCVRQ